ncbi:hypothetical protein GR268_47225, partial [Rhizobium leguminosarum]|nr:hypothetical protein [Rhizobium leguminosarum]
HPYHVDALVQLAEVCKHTGELETATELVERAVFCFESVWHPLFVPSLFRGNARFLFSHEPNRYSPPLPPVIVSTLLISRVLRVVSCCQGFLFGSFQLCADAGHARLQQVPHTHTHTHARAPSHVLGTY